MSEEATKREEDPFDFIKPNWELIDEVSIPLLESGLARFSTLQAVLPSMLTFDATITPTGRSKKRGVNAGIVKQTVGMGLIPQAILMTKSQSQLVEQIKKLECELLLKKKEAKQLKATCSPCGKVFVNQEFLASHLKRRHSNVKNENVGNPM
ncbi:unnamed protein product [Nippostrongylus brasiliensis]|uniref:C2H2-type domain-containing protein n=1 Tax=Nippostrongylus brasiliensis TaxID=27835 RepID=A0A158QZM6_NIPBR|nr:unnamed protein product [Nippostrongylus brasiliensis]